MRQTFWIGMINLVNEMGANVSSHALEVKEVDHKTLGEGLRTKIVGATLNK